MGVLSHSWRQHGRFCIKGDQETGSFQNDPGTLHVPLEGPQGDGGEPTAEHSQHWLLQQQRQGTLQICTGQYNFDGFLRIPHG